MIPLGYQGPPGGSPLRNLEFQTMLASLQAISSPGRNQLSQRWKNWNFFEKWSKLLFKFKIFKMNKWQFKLKYWKINKIKFKFKLIIGISKVLFLLLSLYKLAKPSAGEWYLEFNQQALSFPYTATPSKCTYMVIGRNLVPTRLGAVNLNLLSKVIIPRVPLPLRTYKSSMPYSLSLTCPNQ